MSVTLQSLPARAVDKKFAAGWLPGVFSVNAEFFRLLRASCWPFVDLALRFGLAQLYFVSGVLKLMHWDTALYLAAHEYPVTWMAPATAAAVGAAIEIIAPLFLTAGFMTRYAALPMLLLAAVAQFNYQAFDSQLFWIALLAWYVVRGAGPLSLDGALRRGLADSALPLIPRIVRTSERVGRLCTPVYLGLLRVWLAAALLIAADGATSAHLWLPLATMSAYPGGFAAAAGLMLLCGIATRYVAALLMLAASAGAMHAVATPYTIYLLTSLGLFLIHGAGPFSADGVIGRRLRRYYPEIDGKPAFALEGLPRVVIVGAGFGGLSCAAALRRARASVTLIDRANYHLFQPLLYQVATAAISPGDIAAPVRPLFRDAFNTRVLLGAASGVDTRTREVIIGTQREPYDYLVLATGAAHSYFGKDDWASYAPGLKRIEDATEIRRRLLLAFERAEATDDAAERDALLTFLIVGGGPTGVELAGAIAELARYGMEKDFRRFDPASARIVLVQSGPRILPTFDEKLAAVAQRSLEALGVEVQVGSRVENIDGEGVLVSGRTIPSRTVLWAAGVTASPAARWLDVAADSAGRIQVAADLSVPGLEGVYAVGDTAQSLSWNGQAAPGLAPAAKQAGAYVARVILAALDGSTPPPPFRYRHAGSLATIGRKAAVADFGVLKLWGAPAWWLWGVVHVGFLVGLRNRIATMVNWFWAYLTYGGGIRLITGGDAARPDAG